MKTTRILIVVLVSSLLGVASLSALDFDFGGTLDNASTPTITPVPAGYLVGMDQRNKLAAWLDMRFGTDVSLKAEGSYSFSLLVPYLFDIDYLQVDWQALPWMKVTAGRFLFADFTGHVLNHKLDGAMLTFSVPFAVITASAGYSGLVLKPASTILMTLSDVADQSSTSVYFATQRIVEKVEALVPNYLPRQDLTISAILQQDLRPANTLIQPGETDPFATGGGTLSSQYWGVGLSGAIISNLYYSSFFYLETGTTLGFMTDSSSWQYANILAYLGGIGVKYFNESLLSTRAELEAIISSGDPDNHTFLEGNTAGTSALFVPVSQDSLGIAFQPQWGNLVVIDANYSIKPFGKSPTVWQNLQLVAKVLNFLRPTTGAISSAGVTSTTEEVFLGTEFDLIANFRPLSDLGTALSFGVFVPNPYAFSGATAEPVFAGRLEFSFSF